MREDRISQHNMVGMGFPQEGIVRALEQTQFDFTEALRFLLALIEDDADDTFEDQHEIEPAGSAHETSNVEGCQKPAS